MNANLGDNNVGANQLLFSRRDAAKILGGVSDRTVYNHTRDGRLKATKLGGRILYHRDELARFAQKGTE